MLKKTALFLHGGFPKKSGSHHRHCIELQPESLVAVIDRRAWLHFAASVIRMREDCDDQDFEQDVS